jgi:hypothetical protein
MRRFHANRALEMLVFPLISVAMTWASPDPRLLSLVPPGAQVVAGMSIPMLRGRLRLLYNHFAGHIRMNRTGVCVGAGLTGSKCELLAGTEHF